MKVGDFACSQYLDTCYGLHLRTRLWTTTVFRQLGSTNRRHPGVWQCWPTATIQQSIYDWGLDGTTRAVSHPAGSHRSTHHCSRCAPFATAGQSTRHDVAKSSLGQCSADANEFGRRDAWQCDAADATYGISSTDAAHVPNGTDAANDTHAADENGGYGNECQPNANADGQYGHANGEYGF